MKMSLYCISLDRRNWETVRSARGLNKLLFPYCSILTEELYPTDLLTALCTPEQYDKLKDCAYFAAQGYCEETSPYHKSALSYCPASCSNCVSKSEGTCSFIFIFFSFCHFAFCSLELWLVRLSNIFILRFTVALPLIFPCVIMVIFCSNYLTEGAHSL